MNDWYPMSIIHVTSAHMTARCGLGIAPYMIHDMHAIKIAIIPYLGTMLSRPGYWLHQSMRSIRSCNGSSFLP